MIAFEGMLENPAKEAGIKVPLNVDKFNAQKYPHFKVFCNIQLGRRMPSPTSHWKNAKIIAAIPEDKIKTMTLGQILELGID